MRRDLLTGSFFFSINVTTLHNFSLYFSDKEQELRELKEFAKEHTTNKRTHNGTGNQSILV